jgi:8-amino-7-oxononanoate synthase
MTRQGLEHEAASMLRELASNGLLRSPRVVKQRRGPEVEIGDQWLVNFSSNDYLGYADHPQILETGRKVLETTGGSSASRLVVGNHVEHRQLETRLKDWLGVSGVCLFNSGYAANTGVISSLAGDGDVILSDQLNHASIIDGCRLSRARTVVYRHGDIDDLKQKLESSVGHGRAFVITESLFSMDGDVVDLMAIANLCGRYGASLIVDEAHAIGAVGPRGCGYCAAKGIVPDVLIGTFGKALGVYGAFAATSSAVADLLWNRARSLVFTTGLPPAVLAMCDAAVGLVIGADGDNRRYQLSTRISLFSSSLSENRTIGSNASHIAPIIFRLPDLAMRAAEHCVRQSMLAIAIRPPTVPSSRLRICLRSDHSDEMIVGLTNVLRKLEPEL